MTGLFSSTDKILHNLYLPWPNGTTTEIDQIVITSSGIFVIEVKNYSGWIFGDQWNNYWTQVLPKGYSGKSEKNRFFNPIKQNQQHISCINKNLDYYNVPYHSIVVFSDYCSFKKLSYVPSSVGVVHKKNLRRYIRKIEKNYRGSLNQQEINMLYNKLLKASVKSPGIEKKHITEIKDRQKIQASVSIGNGEICPKCGAPLVLRTARNGAYAGSQFWGCSSFPKCRYIKKK